MHIYRSHTCGALRLTDAGSQARLSGWVHRKRDFGGLLFIDLRDHYGITQLVFNPSSPGFAKVERLRAESVIRVDGNVVARDPETYNANLDTGEVEVRVIEAVVFNRAETPPFSIEDDIKTDEEIRLQNRYLDLRRAPLQRALKVRHEINEPYGVNEYMHFLEGGVTLTASDGTVTEVRAGDSVVIPADWTGVWDTEGYTKIYVIYSPDGPITE